MSKATTDYRLDWILHKGDTIQTADATYTITGEPIGLGGSSVLYPASRSNSNLAYAIKECFPAKPAAYKRDNGIIKTADPNDELNQKKLEEYRKMISKERELGQDIRNITDRAVSAWDELIPISITTGGEVCDDVSDGTFLVLERMDKKGRFFNELLTDIRNACPPEDRQKTFGLPSIQITVQIMEQALRALKQVHDAGYYFGDLSGSNLLLTECDLEKGHVGIGYLIDFGSTRKLEADGYTAPIINEAAFSTDGFRPFEIRDHEDGELRLGKQADIYSAGCLFLHCVLSPAKIRTLGDSPSVGRNALNKVHAKSIGCDGRALQIVNEILEKATEYDPMDRYTDASEMLSAVLELKTVLLKFQKPHFRPKAHHPILLASGNRYQERTSLMIQLDRAFTQNNLVFLSGMSGAGKSELARRYADVRPFDIVHTLSLSCDGTGTFNDLRKQLVADGSFSKDSIERNNELDSLLGNSGKETLIILDNYNSKDNRNIIPELIQKSGAAKILVTTQLNERSLETFAYGEVINLPDDNTFATSVFIRYANLENVSTYSVRNISEIVDALGNHTMMAAIMGSQVRYYSDQNSIDELLCDLRQSLIDVLQYSPSINIVKDLDNLHGDPYNLLKHIFANIIRREITLIERQVISVIMLLPQRWRMQSVICRIVGDLSNRYAKCFQAKMALNKLAEDNLISMQGQNVEIHPLLQQIYTDPGVFTDNQPVLIQDSQFLEHISKNILVEDVAFFKSIYHSDDDLLFYIYCGIKAVWKNSPCDMPHWVALLINSPLSDRIEFNHQNLSDGFLYPYKTLPQYIDNCAGSYWRQKKIGGIYFSLLTGKTGKAIYASILLENGSVQHECIADFGFQLCPQNRYASRLTSLVSGISQFHEACTLCSFVFWIGLEMPILSHVNGIPVTSLGKGAYRMNGRTTGVIPNTINDIGSHAFSDSPNIRTLDSPQGLRKIGDRAFYFCWDLKEATLSSETLEVGDLAFAMCRKLQKIHIPFGLRKIGNAAFLGCTNLSQIAIPSSVTEIGSLDHQEMMVSMGLSSCAFDRNIRIITRKGSYAEQYASEHSLKCIIDPSIP